MSDSAAALTTQPWLDELLGAGLEGIALFDPAGRIVRHNQQLAELLGRPGETFDGTLVAALFEDGTWGLALAAARSRGHWSGRVRGDDRLLEVRLRLAPDGRGVLLGYDISAQVELDRRAESLAAQLEQHSTEADLAREMLFEQSERLTTVYQITLDALESATVRDTAHRIAQALGDDLQAENTAIWLLDQDAHLLRRIAAVGRRARSLPISCLLRDAPAAAAALEAGHAMPPGDAGVLAGLAVFVLPGRGQPLGLLTCDQATDLDKVQVYMPHVATAINNAIMAEEVARANVQLRAIDQQKTEFLNIVAHDLRTPLTCIRTYTDLITMYVDESPETYAEFLGIIAEETERLGELLDNFLDLARIENATLRYEPEPVRLDEIALHFGQVYLAKAASEQIALSVAADEALPPLTADRRRVEQVFSNLLSNAFKFTPAGGRVALTVAAAEDGVQVTVDDTGPGVPVAQRKRIFERFRQADGVHTRGGSGLGLAIAQAVVDHHGGRIWTEDSPLGGARFCFVLPPQPPGNSVVGRCVS